jgi:uncharacterized protein YbjQ (UPF0145 family)
MIVSGMSGNEVFCLAEKGFTPGELTVGNSVRSLGVVGGIGAWGRGITGGEVESVTALISEGRHEAIRRMEKEAGKHGAAGVTSVVSELRSLAGYTEFLSQGTAIHGASPTGKFFSCASSGMELYCHLDAGYHPIRFAMGNVAYALGIGRGIGGSFRTMVRGEVHEFSQMYNHIRHLALQRLRMEAAELGANAVVDVKLRLLPYGPGAVELLMTGTACFHPALSRGPVSEDQVRTSELTGEELWNLAHLGLVPRELVMATSVYSLGVAGGIGTMFKGMTRGELPELTSLIYAARENCLAVVRKEAERVGAERVIGNKLSIRELGPGLIEVVAVGTAVVRAPEMKPASPTLIPQAIIVERDGEESDALTRSDPNVLVNSLQTARRTGANSLMAVRLVVAFMVLMVVFGTSCVGFVTALFASGGHN